MDIDKLVTELATRCLIKRAASSWDNLFANLTSGPAMFGAGGGALLGALTATQTPKGRRKRNLLRHALLGAIAGGGAGTLLNKFVGPISAADILSQFGISPSDAQPTTSQPITTQSTGASQTTTSPTYEIGRLLALTGTGAVAGAQAPNLVSHSLNAAPFWPKWQHVSYPESRVTPDIFPRVMFPKGLKPEQVAQSFKTQINDYVARNQSRFFKDRSPAVLRDPTRKPMFGGPSMTEAVHSGLMREFYRDNAVDAMRVFTPEEVTTALHKVRSPAHEPVPGVPTATTEISPQAWGSKIVRSRPARFAGGLAGLLGGAAADMYLSGK